MKLTTLLLIVTSLQVSATLYSQNTKIDLNIKNGTIQDLFNEIEKQSDFNVFFKSDEINTNMPLEMVANGIMVKDALEEVLKTSQLGYKVLGKIIIIAPSSTLKAQQQKITGTVTDVSTGEPIIGANVLIEGTTMGTITDVNGKFSLDANEGAVLVISFLGYNTEKVAINGQTGLDIKLVPDITKLDEVVVVGYGTQKKRDIIGSVSTVKSNDLEVKSTPTFDAGLQGLAAGVSVQSASGVPGAATKIKIRGMNSINSGTDPLWIVDGMPIVSWNIAQNNGSTDQSPMSLINPQDIESIQVLKDAAATAIYGSRASNGVIIVTTKSGKQGKGTTSIDYSTGVSDLSRKPSDIGYANTQQWFQTLDKAYSNSGKTFDISEYYRIQPFAFTKITRQQAEAINTDWFNELFRKGSFQDLNLSSSRGSDKTQYYISLNYRKDNGVQINNSMKRYTGRANIDFHPTERLSVGTKLSFSYSDNDRMQNSAYRGGASSNGGLNAITTSALPWFPVYDLTNPNQYFNPYSGTNPMAYADKRNLEDNLEQFRGLGGIYLEYKLPFVDGLSIRTEGSFDVMQSNSIFWQSKEIHLDAASKPNSYASDQAVTFRSFNYNAYGTYNKTIGKHEFNLVLGAEATRSKEYSRLSTAQNLVGKYQELGNPAQMLSMWGGIDYERYLMAYFGRVNYKFLGRYMLGFSLRRDGSSVFTSDNRWGTFMALSAGWIVTDEPFMSGLSDKLYLKLRGSYGETGNQNIPGGLDQRLYDGNYIMYGGQSIFGVNGTIPTNIPVNNLKWESTKSTDLGIDFGILSNRINGSVAYYNKYITNMLLQGPIPFSSGVGGHPYNENSPTVWGNLGNMTNSGIEFEIHSTNVKAGDFQWSTDFNIAFNRNEIDKLTQEADKSGKGLITNNYYVSRKGERRNQWFLASYAGVDKQTGVPMIYVLDQATYDKTGETKVLKNKAGGDSLTYATKANIASNRFYQEGKSPDPTYFGGINNTFSYKGFDFSFLVSFSGGNYIYDYDEQIASWAGPAKNFKSDLLTNSWQKPGDIAKYPQLRFANTYIIKGKEVADFGDDWVYYNRCLYKGDYIRLKNVQLGYNLPSSVLKKFNLQALRIYVSGTNLWTKTDYPGFDPEGADFIYTSTIPQLKTFIFGLNVKF